jgi:hypothetical protein
MEIKKLGAKMGLSEDLKKKQVMAVQQGSQSLLCIFFKFFYCVM